MAFPKNTRTVMMVGAGIAVLAAVAAAMTFGAGRKNDPNNIPPASEGSVKIDVTEEGAFEPTRQLRCFVEGQYVGMATLAECASRNGVASSALDVGLDATGALAAAPTASFAPPPARPETPTVPSEGEGTAQGQADKSAPVSASGGVCLRHVGNEWRQIGSNMSMGACVQALYAGNCVRAPGDAQYGRWNDTSLRLVPRRVEQSTDNVRFRTFANQNRNCQFPDL